MFAKEVEGRGEVRRTDETGVRGWKGGLARYLVRYYFAQIRSYLIFHFGVWGSRK